MNEQEHKKTILLVEDEAVIAMMEEKALNKHGFNVIIASSGVKAINAVQNTPDIDLILMDVNLGKGKMDGTEAAEIILKERDIPVLFLSSYTHAEVVQKTERITSYGYVTKDSGETVLIASIKMAFKLHEAHLRLRESEEALQKSEEKYRQLSENAHDFILSMDLDGIIQYANRAACDLASPLNPIGLSMQDITPPNFSQNIPELLRKRREGNDSIFAFEWEIVTPDSGRHVTMDVHSSLLTENGKPSGVLIIARDVTDRKLWEDALRLSEENFHRSLDDSPLGVRIVTIEGETVYANRAMLNIYGYNSILELNTTPVKKRYTQESYVEFRIRKEKRRKGEYAPSEYEVSIVRKNGEVRQLQVFRKEVLWDGERQFQVIYQDITESKKAEEKIKSSLLEKETMLKEIHHRVKNNLQVISSLLDLQSSYLQDEKAKEALQNSMERVKTMASIHTQLYQSQDLTRVDFGLFIRDLIGNISQSCGRTVSPVEIHVDADEVRLGIDASIPCGLILNELVSNALKHAFPEGKEGEVNIRMRSEDNRMSLTVQDNGIGFPESIDLTKLKSLGLELVNLLVGQINGRMDMQVDGGTTWTITFPLKDEREWRNG